MKKTFKCSMSKKKESLLKNKNCVCEQAKNHYASRVNLDADLKVIPTFGEWIGHFEELPDVSDHSISLKSAMEDALYSYIVEDKTNPLYDSFQEEDLLLDDVNFNDNYIVINWHSYIDPENDLGITKKDWNAFIAWLDSKICGASLTVFIGDDVYAKDIGARIPEKSMTFSEYENWISEGY